MKLRSALANSAWPTLSIPDWQQFHHALRHPFQVQRKVLDEIEQTCRGTPVFPGPTDDNPVRDWEVIEPFIARVASGETGVLTRERINHFEPTSGSSSASKLIPSTPLSRRQLNRAICAWVVDTYRRNPGLLCGPACWSISPASSHPPTSAGIRVGYEDDSEYLGVLSQWLVRPSLAVPSPVRRLPVDEFRRATLLVLLAQPELRLISVWNPTFLSALMGYLDEYRDSLLRDLAAGIDVCGYRLQREITGDPWRNLGRISCWADGHAQLQLAENPQYEWAAQVGQLHPVRVVWVSEAAASTYLEVRRARSQKLGDIKPAALDCWGGWHDAFAPLRVED